MPSLEIDGKLCGGSGPIKRYIAEQHGLAGSNKLENFELSTIYGVAHDLIPSLILRIMLHHIEKEEARKAALKKELEETHALS